MAMRLSAAQPAPIVCEFTRLLDEPLILANLPARYALA